MTNPTTERFWEVIKDLSDEQLAQVLLFMEYLVYEQHLEQSRDSTDPQKQDRPPFLPNLSSETTHP